MRRWRQSSHPGKLFCNAALNLDLEFINVQTKINDPATPDARGGNRRSMI